MKSGIRYQLFLLILCIGLIPVVIAGILLGWQSWHTQVDQSLELQREVGHRTLSHIDNFIHTASDHLSLLSTLYDLEKLSADSLNEVFSILATHRDIQHYQMFRDIALFDHKARALGCYSRNNVCTDTFLEESFSSRIINLALDEGQKAFGPILFDADKGTPSVLVAVPLLHPGDSTPYGIIAGNIRIKEVWRILSLLPREIDVSAYVLNDNGRVVAHQNPSVVLRESFLQHPEEEGVRKGLTAEWAVLVREDFFLGDQKLHLVVERPLHSALSFTYKSAFQLALIILLTCACACVLAVSMGKRFIAPIKHLTLKADQISAGDLIQQVELNREDEFGLLADAFNSMSSAIEKQIDSLNQLLAEKEDAFKALSESYSEMEELTYISSHHLQEPVRVLVNYTDLVESRYGDSLDDSGKRYLSHIRQKGALFSKLLTDVMEYLSLNQTKIHRESVDMASVVKQATRKVLSGASNQDAVINTGTLPTIYADRKLLEWVFVQLFDNALKFNDKSVPEVFVNAERDAAGWKISVCDNGIGVDALYREKVFKLFNRLHGAEEYPGTGIGLSLCRKIVLLLGGKGIRLELADNGGTCVVFYLPE